MFYESPSGNTILERSSKFLYEQTIYLLYPDRLELYSESLIRRDTPYKKKYLTKYIKKKDFTIINTIEWIGAPIEFLNKNNFTVLDTENYIESIKQLRKNKKK